MTDMRQSNVVLCPLPDDDHEEEPMRNPEGGEKSVVAAAVPDEMLPLPSNNGTILPSPLKQNFDLLKKRKLSEDEATRISEETASMIRAEVRRMQNAVSELEAYLDSVEERVEEADADGEGAQEEDAPRFPVAAVVVRDDNEPLERRPMRRRRPTNNHFHRFPELPRVVIIEPASPMNHHESNNTNSAEKNDVE